MAHGSVRWVDRLVTLSGAAAFVLMVMGVALFETGGRGAYPGLLGEQSADIMAGLLVQARVGASLLMGAAALQVVFAAVLWVRLRDGQAVQWPAALAFGGGILAAVLMMGGAESALAQYAAGDVRDQVTAQVLVTTTWETAMVWVAPNLAMLAGTAVAGLRGALPRWFALLSGFGAAALAAAIAIPVLPSGLLGVAASAWAVPASAVLFWQSGRPQTASEDAANTEPVLGRPR